MSTSIEKETRVMISREDYISICSDIFKSKPHSLYISQTNYYFDSDSFDLTNANRMVRIRNIKHGYELTYKEKGEDGDTEINEVLSAIQAHKYLNDGSLPHGEVYNAVASTGLSPKKLKVVTSLYTKRLNIQYDNYLLVVDMNRYDDVEDFNIEIESDISVNHAREVLKKYCGQYHLTYRDDYLVKSARAINHAKNK